MTTGRDKVAHGLAVQRHQKEAKSPTREDCRLAQRLQIKSRESGAVGYTIFEGRITDQGPFEGLPPWAPLLWSVASESGRHVQLYGRSVYVLFLSQALRERMGIHVGCWTHVALWKDDFGFVYYWLGNAPEVRRAVVLSESGH